MRQWAGRSGVFVAERAGWGNPWQGPSRGCWAESVWAGCCCTRGGLRRRSGNPPAPGAAAGPDDVGEGVGEKHVPRWGETKGPDETGAWCGHHGASAGSYVAREAGKRRHRAQKQGFARAGAFSILLTRKGRRVETSRLHFGTGKPTEKARSPPFQQHAAAVTAAQCLQSGLSFTPGGHVASPNTCPPNIIGGSVGLPGRGWQISSRLRATAPGHQRLPGRNQTTRWGRNWSPTSSATRLKTCPPIGGMLRLPGAREAG